MIFIYKITNKTPSLNTMEKLCLYPVLSNKLEDSIRGVKCQKVKDLLDRTLWASLYGISLLEEFNFGEFRDLYSWVGENKRPSNFPSLVENKLKKDLGLVFNGIA